MVRRKDPLSIANETDVPVPEMVVEPEVFGEPVPEAIPEPVPDPVILENRPEPIVRRSGMLGPLLGGALAAIGGFALSHFNVFGLAMPDPSVAVLSDRVASLEAAPPADSALQGEVASVAERVVALENAPEGATSDVSALEERLAAIEAAPPGDGASAALVGRLDALEKRLAAAPAAGVDQAEVDAALERLAAAEAEAAKRAEEATAAAAAAEAATALDRLRESVESGAGFEAELAAVGPDLQASLAPHVAGVATLAALQADFPEAARLALQLDRAAADGDGWGSRFVEFLAGQTGARSLTPREGADADAVLSRAEFALSEGRLADAVTEVKALDPTLQAPFADWLTRAETRLAVLAALEVN